MVSLSNYSDFEGVTLWINYTLLHARVRPTSGIHTSKIKTVTRVSQTYYVAVC